ncbi:PepSY-like domain-containing protein [Bacteroides sp.]
MIRFKFCVWTVMLMATMFSLGSCNNEDNYMPPNSDIIVALKQLYPGVEDIEWSQKGVYYVADCRVDGDELDVWFDANANWIMTEMEIYREQLPDAVNTAYEESIYNDWVIDNLTKLTFPHKSEEFVFEVQSGAQERALYYSAYGGLLREKDITNADDTHWPDV